jgi:hypothetical protein
VHLFVLVTIYNCSVRGYGLFFSVKGPAADATDAPQP